MKATIRDNDKDGARVELFGKTGRRVGLTASYRSGFSVVLAYTPGQARRLASALLRAADAAERGTK